MTTYPGGVDSGLLIIGDPAYILSLGQRDSRYKSWEEYTSSIYKKELNNCPIIEHWFPANNGVEFYTIQNFGGDLSYTVKQTSTGINIKFNPNFLPNNWKR